MISFATYFQAGLGIGLIVLFALAVRGVWRYVTKEHGPFERMANAFAAYMDTTRESTEVLKQSTSKLMTSQESHAEACAKSHREIGRIQAAIREACDTVERLMPEMPQFGDPTTASEVSDGIRRIRAALDGTRS